MHASIRRGKTWKVSRRRCIDFIDVPTFFAGSRILRTDKDRAAPWHAVTRLLTRRRGRICRAYRACAMVVDLATDRLGDRVDAR